MGEDDGPLPEAYGRVTNPGRFRVLHAAARDLVDELSSVYAVDRIEDPTAGEALPEVTDGDDAVRLVPENTDGAPLTVTWTSFPGVMVWFGRWHRESFPVCGCDACDEDPDELVATLRQEVQALVDGQFREAIEGRFRPALTYSLPPSSGWSRLSRRQARELGGPVTRIWQPWRVRPNMR